MSIHSLIATYSLHKQHLGVLCRAEECLIGICTLRSDQYTAYLIINYPDIHKITTMETKAIEHVNSFKELAMLKIHR